MMVWLSLVLVGAIGCGGGRDEREGSVTRSGLPQATSPAPISVAAVADAAQATLLDDMVSMPPGKTRARVPKCDKPPPIREIDEPVDDVELELPAFQMDRRPVSCVDYEACIAGGGCKAYNSSSGCSFGHAQVTNAAAAAYCRWRGARLPEYSEWQRAIRGPEGRVYVTGDKLDESKACLKAFRESREPGRVKYCEQSTAEGLAFRTRNLNDGEWTKTVGCRLSRGQKLEAPLAATLLFDRLDLFTVIGDAHEFRCARNLSK